MAISTGGVPCLTVHVFRVEEGLGNACLLQLPDDTCAIVDWGTERPEPLEAALGIAGRGGIRFVAASHAHADHTAGIAMLLRECKRRGIAVGRLVYPASTLNKEFADLTEARRAAKDCGVRMSPVGIDTDQAPPEQWRPPYLAWADDRSWDIRILSPAMTRIAEAEMRALRESEVAGNETSLVILFRFVKQESETGLGRAIFPGDATPATFHFARKIAERFPELRMENQMTLVPHHGSHHNLPEWVSGKMRGIVVISSPTGSLYHPSRPVLEQFCQGGNSSRLFCTSYAGHCAKAFGKRARGADRVLVQPGSCFGDVIVRVPRDAPAEFRESTHPGHDRRKFGYCGSESRT